MKIHSKFKDYEIHIENNIEFIQTLCSVPNTQYVIDKNVYELYKAIFVNIKPDRLIIIEALETNKVIDTALKICEKMTEIPAKRNAQLISVGGGIIQDITGFVANILYRGIKWIFVPTTLLASCDSCIGGKTSLNYKKYKNLLGTFYPPDHIYICADFFQTLSERDFESGLGEVVKFNIMAGKDGLQRIAENIEKLLTRDTTTIHSFVKNSLEYKKTFIEIDEFDRNERIKLNFAHTFGHAIEVISNYGIPHGTAVAIGMIMANSISLKRGLLDITFVNSSENVLLKVIKVDVSLLNAPINKIIDAIRKDKKQVDNALTAVLLTEELKEHIDLKIIHDLTEEEVSYALEYFIKLYDNSAKREDL